ncbi:hypothetical protein F511_25228 [Dorcoceras hygrometricum]|uniref:Uncharacterized protein n=1 Tax=Dorcoceras hygrometricum TaxID=472368 RepID=A0A2Z7BH35_9LAMI|nr:hypothetical protein F511_25228 [Dorcoceras hygrometricum]
MKSRVQVQRDEVQNGSSADQVQRTGAVIECKSEYKRNWLEVTPKDEEESACWNSVSIDKTKMAYPRRPAWRTAQMKNIWGAAWHKSSTGIKRSIEKSRIVQAQIREISLNKQILAQLSTAIKLSLRMIVDSFASGNFHDLISAIDSSILSFECVQQLNVLQQVVQQLFAQLLSFCHNTSRNSCFFSASGFRSFAIQSTGIKSFPFATTSHLVFLFIVLRLVVQTLILKCLRLLVVQSLVVKCLRLDFPTTVRSNDVVSTYSNDIVCYASSTGLLYFTAAVSGCTVAACWSDEDVVQCSVFSSSGPAVNGCTDMVVHSSV